MLTYRAKLDADNARARRQAHAGRDIAPGYPRRRPAARRRRCERELRLYLETYHRGTFPLPWSRDQLRVIDIAQGCILGGGLFAVGMPRGSGKTSILLRAALWAILFRHRRFAVPIGATRPAAIELLATLKTELAYNERLAADFRHVTYPIRCLQEITRRAAGQTFDGTPTRIKWTANQITLPVMPAHALDGPDVGGSVLAVASITGALRGMSHTLSDGTVLRPDIVLLDDVQTRRSARSAPETAERLAAVRGDVLAMAGPGQSIAALAALTVIAGSDLADQLLDREANPQWQGIRCRAVYSWPTAEAEWAEYHKLRRQSLRAGRKGEEATAFYAGRRGLMDRGADVAWSERFNPGELSGVQHLHNLRHDLGEAAFNAEYQNEPLREMVEEVPTLTAEQIAGKLNRLPRGLVPLGAAHLTCFVDTHDSLLVWAVAAVAPDFTASVIDYGTYPGQHRPDWTLRTAHPTLADRAPGAGREGAILKGLETLTGDLLRREWRREDGTALRIERCLCDSGYAPEVIFALCRRSPHAAVLLPSRGKGIGPAERPMAEYEQREGERHGTEWLLRPVAKRAARHLIFNSNFWKSFVFARLAVARGDRGGLELFGSDPEAHRLLASHLKAEMPVRMTASGRTVDVWRTRPGAGDNHYLDCISGLLVAASLLGAALPESGAVLPKQRKTVSLRELQLLRQKRRGLLPAAR